MHLERRRSGLIMIYTIITVDTHGRNINIFIYKNIIKIKPIYKVLQIKICLDSFFESIKGK